MKTESEIQQDLDEQIRIIANLQNTIRKDDTATLRFRDLIYAQGRRDALREVLKK